jgi:O-acetyl-ADP-ribose deacetylase (regulator of RNase III)
MKVEVKITNIVNQPDLEAIVNSANAKLQLGSGVAGAIHTAAGSELEEFCKPYAPLAFGHAIISPGFKLTNKWVIHTRAANYLLDDDAKEVLRKCLAAVFDLAKEKDIKSLGLPAIGTGIFKFPIDLVAEITAQAINDHQNSGFELVRICVIDSATQGKFLEVFNASQISLT